ncbi:MAG: o-succinylbenzoate--CoA ligase [Deltaproteobacteria bacterium]|nr:o-succinylbenzoate--CoA ligase [Deltaproteobacteria bacterium]
MHWLWQRAAQTPEKLALVCGAERLRFADLAARAEDWAARLQVAGLGRGDRLALRLRPGVDFAALLHAAWRIGAIAAPLNLRLAQAELQSQLARIAPRLILDGEAVVGEPPEALPQARGAAPVPLPPPLRPEAAALILFTSGASGFAKAACLSFGALEASARASAQRLQSRATDRWLACLPLFHVSGLSILLRSALDGSAVVLHEGFEAARVRRALATESITHVSLVPTALSRLLDAGGAPPAALRAVLLGGAAADFALCQRARRAGFPLLATYGLTEAASQVATMAPGDAPDSGAGRPLPGTALRIVNAAGRALPPGESGEIWVRGPTLFMGYWNDAEASRAALRDGWLRTGDLGHLDAQGRLHVHGRRDDLIVSGGENIHPAEVEAVLLRHPAVREAAVCGLADGDLGQRAAAFIVPERAAPPDSHPALAQSLREHCRAHLAGYKIPRSFQFRSNLPRTALGKLMRRRLRPDSPGSPE